MPPTPSIRLIRYRPANRLPGVNIPPPEEPLCESDAMVADADIVASASRLEGRADPLAKVTSGSDRNGAVQTTQRSSVSGVSLRH